jgi:FtsH-binding integral membrane protein
VALWWSPRRPAFQAVACGLAVAATGFTTIAIALNAGTAAVSGILPTLLVVAAEFWLAFKLRARIQRRPAVAGESKK